MGLADLWGGTADAPPPPPKWGGLSAGNYNNLGEYAQGREGATIGSSNYGQPGWQQAYGQATTNDNQSRSAQQSLIDQLNTVANGDSNSVAQLQQQAGIEDSIKAQASLAASAQGGGANAALAARNAAVQGGDMRQAGVFQASQLRAQESAAARAQMGQAVQGLRSGDLQSRAQALQGMGMSQQQALAQAQLEQQQKAQNDQYGLGAYGLGNQAAQAQLGADSGNQSLQQQNQQFNATANTGAITGIVGAAGGAAAAAGTGGASLAIPAAGAAAKSDVHSKTRIEDLSRENAALTSALGNQGQGLAGASYARTGGQASPQAAEFADTRAHTTGLNNPGSPFGVIAERVAPIPYLGGGSPWDPHPSDVRDMQRNGSLAEAERAQLRAHDPNVDAYAKLAPPPVPFSPPGRREASSIETSADGQALATSDVRAKSNIDTMLSAVRPVAFDYKDPQRDGAGRHVGVLAQDLERGGLGNMVVDTPQGKMVDTKQASMAGLAGLADHNERIRALERGSTLGPRGR